MSDDPDRFRLNLRTDELGESVPAAITELRALLSHDFAPVREGAVYALAAILGEVDGVAAELRRMATEDPSPGVREACEGMLTP